MTTSGSVLPLIPPIKSSVPACCQESSCRPGHSQEVSQVPRPGSCSIRGQRVWPAYDCPHLLSVCPAASPSIEESCCDLEFPLLCTAQPVSYHRMFPNLLNPVSAPRGQGKSQSMHKERGRVTVLRGASVFGMQEVAAAPTIHSPLTCTQVSAHKDVVTAVVGTELI